MTFRLTINGFEDDVSFDDKAIQAVFLPLLKKLTALAKESDKRLVAFLAAPPAAGKSTLAAFLEQLSNETPGILPVQALGMDGFHHHQDYILTHTVLRGNEHIPMKQIKGAPESFDIAKLHVALDVLKTDDILWPVYDRRIHDVVEDALPVHAPIALIEGNWLLLDRPLWRDLPCDFAVFIEADEADLRGRLIARKERGGLTHEAALAYYEGCDGPNVRLCLAESKRGDLTLRMTGMGAFDVLPPGKP